MTRRGRKEKGGSKGLGLDHSRLPEGIQGPTIDPCPRGKVVDQGTDVVQRHVHSLNH